ncbi:S41 family peptidase [Porphyromonas pogonae]|uniref:S41 family peptidase n=1 Tax=Porphyromonas pogonae TaxID=867595 RepID=UPI002E76FD71|nr:S41 family peptidase [Porphyromonas pogonae]
MKRKPIITLLFTLSLLWLGGSHALAQNKVNQLLKLKLVMESISNMYVDPVNQDSLVESAITGMLSDLDPHSTYTNPHETRLILEPLQGHFSGIGVRFVMLSDTLNVIEVIKDGPSYKGGLKPGDKILKANGVKISGDSVSTDSIMPVLKGPRGSKVDIEYMRAHASQPTSTTLIRDNITINSIESHYIIDNKYGYVRLGQFAQNTASELADVFKEFKSRHVKGIIIDLQYNGGGYLNAAIEMGAMFIGDNRDIVTVKNNRHPSISNSYKSKGNPTFDSSMPVVVMVNEFSASASEIFAGAIQDWDRGVIVGRRTYGKGLVQRPIPLPDESMIRLTIARYYTPSGRCIQKQYRKGNKKEYEEEILSRIKHGELVSSDSIGFPDSLKYKTLIHDRVIYGGGGIMPDLFVPLDTTRYNKVATELIMNNVITAVALNHVSEVGRARLLQEYPTMHQFYNYVIPEAIIRKTAVYGKEKIKEWDDKLFEQAIPVITQRMRAELARDIYGSGAFYYVVNKEDPTYGAAIRLLENPSRYHNLLNPKQTK